MKLLLLLFLLSGAVVVISYGQSTTKKMTKTAQLKQEIELACRLTDKDQIRRMNELHQSLFKKVSRVIDHQDAVELVFAQPDSLISNELGEFIRFERLCCPWLLFQLTYLPEHGPVSLKMGNSPKTKQMVELVMELDKIRH